MCGRFTRSKPVRAVADLFSLPEPPPELEPRYNIAPSQLVAVVGRKSDGTRKLALLEWGFVPNWSNEPNPTLKPINAKAETILDKPVSREAFLSHRCLIPASGFYEWQKHGKVPYHIQPRDGGLVAFAGIFDVWQAEGEKPLATCCIITTEANELVRPLHDRMPVIVRRFIGW